MFHLIHFHTLDLLTSMTKKLDIFWKFFIKIFAFINHDHKKVHGIYSSSLTETRLQKLSGA